MSDVKHKFQIGIGAKTSAIRNNDNVQQRLSDAIKKGGDNVKTLFKNDLAALNKLYTDIGTGGDSIWINGIDTTSGAPTWYVVAGDTMLTIGLYVTDLGSKVLSKGTGGVDDMQAIGFAYVTLVTGAESETQTVSQVATNLVQYAGEGIPNIEAGDALKKVIEKNASVLKKFVVKIIQLAMNSSAASPAVARTAAEANAEQAASYASTSEESIAISETETIVADIEVSVADVVGLVFSLGTLALTIILNLLIKQITGFARFYNATDADIEFSICWIKEGSAAAVTPALPNTPITIPAVGPAWTPPWIIGDETLHFVDMVFANTDTLKGIGYVLKARPNGDFPGFNVMVNIPNAGDNSMQASFVTDDNCYSYWQESKNQNTVNTLNASSGVYTLSIATNQISGKSPSPVDGQNGYNYEHLIVLEKHS
ncbi:MAG: hypothetical protein ACU833_02085 [Gammaproteobacteria bacterium]